jgi:lysophospholipase L1-like esterase
MTRRFTVGTLLATAVVALSALLPSTATATTYPRVMAATGDSITRAFNTGFWPFTDNPSASWSTGSDNRVNSHYLRLLAASPTGKLAAYNDARSGAKMADLNGQMTKAVSQRAEYVTVLMGANDVCTSSESTMTSVQTFRTQFTTAMDTVASGLPRVKVLVVSIPDIQHLWEVLHTNYWARLTWNTFDICQSMLANPGSTNQADADRRQRVKERNMAFNNVLADVCAEYAQCRFDGFAAFTTQFTTSDVSTRDYFHPSISGEAKLASVSWKVSYWAN